MTTYGSLFKHTTPEALEEARAMYAETDHRDDRRRTERRVHDALDALDARVAALRAWANTDGRGATPAPDIAALVDAVVVGVRSANGTQRARTPLWDQYGDGVQGR